ncbi:MAG: hypothetical protein AAGE86_03345 [Pseudomonadota bacterium]
MWGADTPLVIDALQMVAVAAIIGGGAVFALLRLRRNAKAETKPRAKTDLEERVRVLERIATDRSQDLAQEIEQLRDNSKAKESA